MEQHERLQKARMDAGFSSAASAADAFGWTYNTYLSHENGARGFRLPAARKYARAFKVPVSWLMMTDKSDIEAAPVAMVRVAGEVAAGVWLEAEESLPWDETLVPAAPIPEFPVETQIAVKVRGTSMNKVFRDGEYAIAALYGYTRDVIDKDIVVVRRHRAGLVETSLKRYRANGGKPMLVPESDDPQHQKPLPLESDEEDARVEIFAIVIGRYQSLV